MTLIPHIRHDLGLTWMLEETRLTTFLLWTVPVDNQCPFSVKSDLAETKFRKTFSVQVFEHLKFSFSVQYEKKIQKEMCKASTL